MPEFFNVESFLSGGFGRMRGEKPVGIRLRIAHPASAWIGGSTWHSSQKIQKHDNGAITLTMNCPVTDTLVRWILQMAGSVKVEAPRELREAVLKSSRELVANNKEKWR